MTGKEVDVDTLDWNMCVDKDTGEYVIVYTDRTKIKLDASPEFPDEEK